MPRVNRVDPYGDVHAVPERGMFTGNRGCLVDQNGCVDRHHRGSLWIVCRTTFREWRHPLDAPKTWTPLFFLDDAVALAAGHRPCRLCRRSDYVTYQEAVSSALDRDLPILAPELNRLLAQQRLQPGSGIVRSADRLLWPAPLRSLPVGSVFVDRPGDVPQLRTSEAVQRFSFGGWGPLEPIVDRTVQVLTPPTSVAALNHGFTPVLHPSAVHPG